ncbi:MAG TPA: aldo/keto reductase [Rectinemataceae bacterium]|nr:aldo/keto reductase [Rectinemataceae bacterium]
MELVSLVNTDLRVSRLIAGCMGLGGSWEKSVVLGEIHEAQAKSFLEKALDEGINFFDHANVYAYGRAEEIFGRTLARRPGLRSRIVIQSKCGIRWADDPPGSPHRFDFSREHILYSVEGSLRRLHTDHLDILLLHRPDVLWEGEEIAEAFAALKAEGKVRYFGVSNMNRGMMEYLQHFLPDPLVANQLQMSLLHHDFAEVGISFNQTVPDYPNGWEGVLEYCRLNGVAPQAWSALDKGILAAEDLSRLTPVQRSAAETVRRMALEKKVSPEAIALAWLLRHPAGIMPVLGTTKPERLCACAKATELTMSREEWYLLFEAARGRKAP